MEGEGNTSDQTISVKNRARKISKRIKVVNKPPRDDENSNEQTGLQPQKRRVRASVRSETTLKDRVANLEGGGETKKKTIRVRKSVRKSVRDQPDEEMRRKFHMMAADNSEEKKSAGATLHPEGPGTKRVPRESVRMIKTSLSTRRRAFLSAQNAEKAESKPSETSEENGAPPKRVSRRIRVKSIKVRPTETGDDGPKTEGASDDMTVQKLLSQGHTRRIPASEVRRTAKLSQDGEKETKQTLSAEGSEQGTLTGRPRKLRMSRMVKFQPKALPQERKEGETLEKPVMIRRVSTRKVRRSVRKAPERAADTADSNDKENQDGAKILGDGKITMTSGNRSSFARKSVIRVSRRVKTSSLAIPGQEEDNKEPEEGLTVGRPKKLRMSKYVKVQDKQGTVRRVLRASARHAGPLADRIKAFKEAAEDGKKEDNSGPKPQYRKKFLDAFIKEGGDEENDTNDKDGKPVQVRRVSKRIVRKSMRNAPSLRTRAKQLQKAQTEPDEGLDEIKQQRLDEATEAIIKKTVALPIGTYHVIPDSEEDEESDSKEETTDVPKKEIPYDGAPTNEKKGGTLEQQRNAAPVPAKRTHIKADIDEKATKHQERKPEAAEEAIATDSHEVYKKQTETPDKDTNTEVSDTKRPAEPTKEKRETDEPSEVQPSYSYDSHEEPEQNDSSTTYTTDKQLNEEPPVTATPENLYQNELTQETKQHAESRPDDAASNIESYIEPTKETTDTNQSYEQTSTEISAPDERENESENQITEATGLHDEKDQALEEIEDEIPDASESHEEPSDETPTPTATEEHEVNNKDSITTDSYKESPEDASDANETNVQPEKISTELSNEQLQDTPDDTSNEPVTEENQKAIELSDEPLQNTQDTVEAEKPSEPVAETSTGAFAADKKHEDLEQNDREAYEPQKNLAQDKQLDMKHNDSTVDADTSEMHSKEENKEERAEAKEEIADTTGESTETKEECTQIKEERTETEEETTETKQDSTEAKEESADTTGESTETKEECTVTEEERAETKEEENAETKQDSTEAKEESADTTGESTETKEECTVTEEERAETKEEENADTEQDSTEAKEENAATTEESIEQPKEEIPEMQVVSSSNMPKDAEPITDETISKQEMTEDSETNQSQDDEVLTQESTALTQKNVTPNQVYEESDAKGDGETRQETEGDVNTSQDIPETYDKPSPTEIGDEMNQQTAESHDEPSESATTESYGEKADETIKTVEVEETQEAAVPTQPKPTPRRTRQEPADENPKTEQESVETTSNAAQYEAAPLTVDSPVKRSDKSQMSFKRSTVTSGSEVLPPELMARVKPKQDVLLNEDQLEDADYDEYGQLIINEKWRMRCRAKYIHIYRQHAQDANEREDKEREQQLLQKIKEMEAQSSYVEEEIISQPPSKETIPMDLEVEKAEVYSDISDHLSDQNEVVAAEDQANMGDEDVSEYDEEEEEEEEYYDDEEEEEYEDEEYVEYEDEEDVEYVDEEIEYEDEDEDVEYEEEEVVVYVDEDGNEIEVGDDVEFDEDGNQIIYVTDSEDEEVGSDEEVVYVDEDGNYVDADGNPIDEDEVEVVEEYEDEEEEDDEEVIYMDEDGNYVDADGNIVDYVPDSDDEVIED